MAHEFKEIEYGLHPRQKMDVFIPNQDQFKTLIYFHGGGLESGDKIDGRLYLDELGAKGIATVAVNYRLYPDAKYPDFILDAALAIKHAVDLLRTIDPDTKIYIAGSSAGAYILSMLLFDPSFLLIHGIDPDSFSGYLFNASQPTTHFNVLKERGIDPSKIVVDEASMLYHINSKRHYPPMVFMAAERDIPMRLEQIQLALSSLKQHGFADRTRFIYMKGYDHCAYNSAVDEDGRSVFAKILFDFLA